MNKVNECVNVLDYGAIGNGKTDDSNAIQAAIDDYSKIVHVNRVNTPH